ncbi:hypothetical protein ILUMI_07788 [Ignelater luminosus]|uniref:Uncharacterized protein n=1 Tax=Ignelater luminosus TaxID=2038154 RepID=A0A8K0D2T6_IGNLU|nr:hypothetical protein ILUMI_07788 [Ignelater luminosus]
MCSPCSGCGPCAPCSGCGPSFPCPTYPFPRCSVCPTPPKLTPSFPPLTRDKIPCFQIPYEFPVYTCPFTCTPCAGPCLSPCMIACEPKCCPC